MGGRVSIIGQGASRFGLFAIIATPATVIFLSSNLVNAGNLAFNIIFSRWMGPELFGDLALILTVKLSILGVLGAAQFSTSKLTAPADAFGNRQQAELARLNWVAFAALWMILPLVGAAIYISDFGTLIGLQSPILLLILLFSLPFAAPLSILRGIAFGRQMTARIVLTANVEMGTRLIGSVIAWQLGFGIHGVVVAIAISIVAAWVVLADILPLHSKATAPVRPLLKTLGLAAFPFAVLQLAQVISLDGEIFLASAVLAPEQSGFIAALSLFQRIEFFACFGLASVLLPGVVKASGTVSGVIRAAAPIGALYLCVAVPFLILVWMVPEYLVSLLVGPMFLEASRAMVPASFAAAAFTLSYLLATLLVALGDNKGIWFVAATAFIQLSTMGAISINPNADFVVLVSVKAAFQVALAMLLCLYTVMALRQRAVA